MVYRNVGRFQFLSGFMKRNIIEASSYVVDNASKLLETGYSSIHPYKRLLGPTADEVTKDIDLSGKTCLITGGSSGIGFEITRCLSSRNCEMLVACRNPYATTQVAKTYMGDRSDELKLFEVNLASLASVKKCADEILGNVEKLDIVILNAAVFGLPWIQTEDELETTFQVNYLSHYYLLSQIEKLLAPNSRVVVIASESHRYVNWDLTSALLPSEDKVSLPFKEYTTIRAYNVSKLCCMLMCTYLKYQWMNSDKKVFAVHPGSFVKTKLCQNWWVYEALYTAMIPFSKSIKQAASTPAMVATNDSVMHSAAMYYRNCAPAEESVLAADRYLAFRINDLAADLLRARTNYCTPLAVPSEPSDLSATRSLPHHTPDTMRPPTSKHETELLIH